MAYPVSAWQLFATPSDKPCHDLRSDTVTRPCAAMRQAMADAEVGDDVFGDDPTVTRLETRVAETLGKEAGLLLPSGTQSNLTAVLNHCGRGEGVMLGESYHVYVHEAGGASVLGGVPYVTLPEGENRIPTPHTIAVAIRPDDPHHFPIRLLSLENTVSGYAVPLADIDAAIRVARTHRIATHLDGARFFNAITVLDCQAKELAAPFDSVSVCLSKGLGAPVGSVLVGTRDFIARARYLRKILGGGMRQAGVLAAAGLFALEHVRPRLIDDHCRAAALADTLRTLEAGSVEQHSNMVFFTPNPGLDPHEIARGLAVEGVKILPEPSMRYVLHRDISDSGLKQVCAAFTRVLDGVGQ